MSPTLTGEMKVMASTATVTTRPLARSMAAMAPAMSIWLITQPPKMSPAGLVSAGIASAAGYLERPLPLPPQPSLRGFEFTAQAAVFDPARSLIGGITLTEGLSIRVGE